MGNNQSNITWDTWDILFQPTKIDEIMFPRAFMIMRKLSGPMAFNGKKSLSNLVQIGVNDGVITAKSLWECRPAASENIFIMDNWPIWYHLSRIGKGVYINNISQFCLLSKVRKSSFCMRRLCDLSGSGGTRIGQAYRKGSEPEASLTTVRDQRSKINSLRTQKTWPWPLKMNEKLDSAKIKDQWLTYRIAKCGVREDNSEKKSNEHWIIIL